MGAASSRWQAGATQAGIGVVWVSGRNGARRTNASAATAGSKASRTLPWLSGQREAPRDVGQDGEEDGAGQAAGDQRDPRHRPG